MSLVKCSWPPAPENLTLADDAVHVWCVDLQRSPTEIAALFQLLAADERQRAEQFYFERDRHSFTVCRGLLRVVLGRYLGQSPDTIQFCYGDRGKPALASEVMPLQFNVSHSHGMALYAITLKARVGVDLEKMRSLRDVEQLTRRFFAEREAELISQLYGDAQQQAFFNAWTRKEAFLKATGHGLAYELNQVEVSLLPGEPAQLLRIPGEEKTSHAWWLQALEPLPGYAAALVVEGQPQQLDCWQLPDELL